MSYPAPPPASGYPAPAQPYQQVAPAYPAQQYPPAQQYAPPAQYAPAQQFAPAQQYPPPAPVQPAPPGYRPTDPGCRICGCMPAAEVTFRQHRGMIVLMQFMRSKGPFCRDCGLAVFRNTTAKTLIQGWWGYGSSIITPITVLINAARRGKVASLPEPRPPMDGRPYRRPLDPGPALFARPSAIIGLLIPVLLALFVVALVVASAASSST